MIHLKKFNEGFVPKNLQSFFDYIKDCFIEFADKNELLVEYESGRIIVEVMLPDEIHRDSVENCLKSLDSLKEFYLEIENCIEKVKLKYDIDVDFNINSIQFQDITGGYTKDRSITLTF